MASGTDEPRVSLHDIITRTGRRAATSIATAAATYMYGPNPYDYTPVYYGPYPYPPTVPQDPPEVKWYGVGDALTILCQNVKCAKAFELSTPNINSVMPLTVRCPHCGKIHKVEITLE